MREESDQARGVACFNTAQHYHPNSDELLLSMRMMASCFRPMASIEPAAPTRAIPVAVHAPATFPRRGCLLCGLWRDHMATARRSGGKAKNAAERRQEHGGWGGGGGGWWWMRASEEASGGGRGGEGWEEGGGQGWARASRWVMIDGMLV